MDFRVRRSGAGLSVRIAFVGVLVVFAGALGLVSSGVIQSAAQPFSTYAQAQSEATSTAAGAAGGPWALGLITGVNLAYGIPESNWAGENCTAVSGTLDVPPMGGLVGGFNLNLSDGRLPSWFFFYVADSRNQSTVREMLILVRGDQASLIGEVALSRGCGLGVVGGGVQGTVVGSDVVASAFQALPLTRSFAQNHTVVAVTYLLTNDVPTPQWVIEETDCYSAPAGEMVNGTLISATFSATDGAHIGPYDETTNGECSLMMPFPPYWS